MASIYESPGQQVALTGYQGPQGFSPGQAYDPSRMMLAQSERDLRAFSEFSDTLTKFIVDKAKEKSQQEMNLGIADILNGELTMKPDVMDNYKQNVKVLEQAADNDVNVAEELSQKDLAAGETYRQQSRSISGWRAYGQAVGKAQLAASQAEGLLDTFLRDNTEPLTIRQPDGSIKTFTAATAENQPELMAAWSVGLQKFMASSGVANLNPALLVEYVTPTMLKVRAKLIGERMTEIARNRQAGEQERLNITVGQNLEGLKDPELGQQILSALLSDAKQAFNGNWAQANQFVNDAVLSKIAAYAQGNPQEADAILNAYSNLAINPNKPELGTIYNRYSEEIEKARAIIKGTVREQAAEEEAGIKEEINTIVNTWRAASETGNLRQSQQAFDAAEQELSKLASRYPEATEALSQIRQFGRNYNSLTEEAVVKAVAGGSIKTRAELSVLASNGYITRETANKLSEQLPEDDTIDTVKTLRPRIEAFVRNQLRGLITVQGGDFENFKDQTLPLVGALTDELMEKGISELAERRANGRTLGTAQLEAILQKQALDALKTERFKPSVNNGRLILPTPARNLPTSIPYSTGPSGKNYSKQIVDRLPPVVSAKRDVLLDSEKIQANIDTLNNGGQPSADLVTIAKAANLPVTTVLAQQAQKYGITYSPTSSNAAAQRLKINMALDPGAAQILANPRSTASQRIRATARLSEARRRQAATSSVSASGKLGAGDYGGLAALTSSGEGGFNSVNRGTAGDTPKGMKLTSMSIGDVERMQKNGEIFAAGFAQWIPGNLALARSAAGLPATAKMTPENQLKMFWAYILNSDKRPSLRDYLLGKSNDLLTAHREFAREWAAVQGPEGYGYYDNDKAGNRASLAAKRVQEALRRARQEILSSR